MPSPAPPLLVCSLSGFARFSRLFVAPQALALGLTLAGGCRAAGPPAPPSPAALLHWPAPAAPAVQADNPRLWVALAAHLGSRQELSLRAASGVVQLRDAAGLAFEAPALRLRWVRRPLPQPLQLRRQVLGPYPSYESAEAVAELWRQVGAQPLVAHPRDWEVWAAADAPAPPEQQPALRPRLEERRETEAWVPVLETPLGGRSLQGPIQLTAPGGLQWQGGVFAGPFRLQADAYGTWSLVEQVSLERYLHGVVPHEIGAGAPAAALQAQAVLARTWALRNRGRFAVDGYHLCADTQCQVYSDPRHAGPAVSRAITATGGRVLAWRGQPIHAVYHASNGGVSAALEEVWSAAPQPYLRSALDIPPERLAPLGLSLPLDEPGLARLLASAVAGHGADHPRFRWRRQVDAAALTAAARSQQPDFGIATQVRVLERGPSGRVMALAIEARQTPGPVQQVVLRRDGIRRALRQLPSTLFVVKPAGPGLWRFEGGGFGHGAGLSQAGAIDLAARGWGLEQILSRYYPGTQLLPLAGLGPSSPPAPPEHAP